LTVRPEGLKHTLPIKENMCGFGGILYFHKDREVSHKVLAGMADTIIHRGPDDQGYYIDGNFGLCFRRLSIIDINTGHQPLSNADGSLWIVFNGEIYNFLQLRRELILKGYTFKTKTDTETLLLLYEEYGEVCVGHLRGMFAFAIWDKRKHRLFCGRDRFGIKPFYFYRDHEKFVFASEIKEILTLEKIPRQISSEAIDSYFAYGYITSNLSIYEGIVNMPPAHTLTLSPSGTNEPKINKYWSITFDPDYSKTEEEWCEEIDTTLSDTVKLHMISDVPLGAFLSGGIDSSAVLAMMSGNSNAPIKTFSIGFNEQEFNELEYAGVMAKKYNTEHHEQIVDPGSADLLPLLVKAYDEPFADTSSIPTYYLSKFARQFVTVALSGDGGDELFAGYSAYSKLKKIYNLWLNKPFFNNYLFQPLSGIYPEKFYGKKLLYYLSINRKSLPGKYCLWSEEERNKLYHIDFSGSLNRFHVELLKQSVVDSYSSNDFVSGLQALDMLTYLPDDILTKVDRASMQNSLEVRVPFLDHKFAELSFRIPVEMKIRKYEKKYILKKALTKILPEKILLHRKQGFGVPLKYWFKDDLNEYMYDKLSDRNNKVFSYLDYGFVQKILHYHCSGIHDFSAKIWSVLFFSEWLNTQYG